MFLSDDDMVECPYNKVHRMLRRRLQAHLHKCRLNYPDVELRKCPFNTTHLIPEPEFANHATNCPDRKLISQYKYDAPEPKEEEVPKHDPIECEEDWDDTDVIDYNPQKYLENANVLRKPDGKPSERKEFIKKERKRLGDGDDSSDEEKNKSNTAKEELKPSTSSKRGDNTGETAWSHGSQFNSAHCNRRSRSPLSYSNQRFPSPHTSRRDRSRSPGGYRRYCRDNSPKRSSSPDYSQSHISSNSLRSTSYSYNYPYYSSGRNNRSNISHSDHSDSDTESNTLMPPTPPPPIISYPAPRSYLTSKYSTSSE